MGLYHTDPITAHDRSAHSIVYFIFLVYDLNHVRPIHHGPKMMFLESNFYLLAASISVAETSNTLNKYNRVSNLVDVSYNP